MRVALGNQNESMYTLRHETKSSIRGPYRMNVTSDPLFSKVGFRLFGLNLLICACLCENKRAIP